MHGTITKKLSVIAMSVAAEVFQAMRMAKNSNAARFDVVYVFPVSLSSYKVANHFISLALITHIGSLCL